MDAEQGDVREGGHRARLLLLLAVLGAGGLGWARLRQPAPEEPAPPPAPLPGRPRLVTVLGGTLRHGDPVEPDETVLCEGRQVLGRDKHADVHLRDLTVSPRHALIEADRAGRVVVRDLGARNGLRVDGIPVAEAELHDGNRLQLGDVQLVYRTDPRNDDGGRSGGELGEQPGS